MLVKGKCLDLIVNVKRDINHLLQVDVAELM